MSQRQSSKTENSRKVSHREDGKETAKRQVSHRQGSSTEGNTKVSDREDQKQTAQGQVSHRQSSTTEDNRMLWDREDVEETAQGQVSQGQGSTTEHNRNIANREDGKEAAQGRVCQGQGSSTEKNRIVSDREDGEETAQGRVSNTQCSTSKDNTEIANREDGRKTAQGRVSHRQGSTTEDNREEGLKENRGISVKEDNQLIPDTNKDEDKFNYNTTVAEDFRSSDTKEVTTTNPGAINYQSTSQSIAQMNPYGNNHTASWFPPTNMHTSTPINEASFPFMDPIMDNLYSKNVMRNFSVQPAPSGNPTSTIFGNTNSILYGMDNYGNDVPQQSFDSTEECNIGKKHQNKEINRQQKNTSRNFSGTRAT